MRDLYSYVELVDEDSYQVMSIRFLLTVFLNNNWTSKVQSNVCPGTCLIMLAPQWCQEELVDGGTKEPVNKIKPRNLTNQNKQRV
jgi:hypothetical protein